MSDQDLSVFISKSTREPSDKNNDKIFRNL